MTGQITVYCDEPAHAERRWDIMRFTRNTEGRWRGSNLRFKSTRRVLDGEVKTMLWLEDERRYRRLGEPLPVRGPARVRPELQCGLCPLAFKRRDTTVLDAVLDKLAEAGQTQISVRTFNAIAARIESVTK